MNSTIKFEKSKNYNSFSYDETPKILNQTPQTVTKAQYQIINHNSGKEEIKLKIWRQGYGNKEIKLSDRVDNIIKFINNACNLDASKLEEVKNIIESSKAKNQITLDKDSIEQLGEYLSCYIPIRNGAKHFVELDSTTSEIIKTIQNSRITNDEDFLSIFNELIRKTDNKKIAEAIIRSDISYIDIQKALEIRKKQDAISQFEDMLKNDLSESDWQSWFEENSWVLGSDFVEILDERKVDTKNITDYLVKSYDGFLDIIEIKKPEDGKLDFWSKTRDHGNLVPSSSLIKAITQATKYIYEVERESNSNKFLKRVKVPIVKPRSILIFGRSNSWSDDENEAYRIINSSYHNLLIMTYDHVLDRAKRIINNLSYEKENINQRTDFVDDQEIPF